MKRQIIFLAIVYLVVCSTGLAEPPGLSEQEVALTIYNENFAVVRESRPIVFEQSPST